MEKPPSYKLSARPEVQVRQELQVFAWNLRSVATPFERHSLALNAIEHGRAWHWRLLPTGWANTEFILRHGQLKTKRAFTTFFPRLKRTKFHQKQTTKIKKPAAGEAPLAWETIDSKYIPGLKVTQFADLIEAKISALSTRGFARDFVDLYAAHNQRQPNWRSFLINASKNQLNDYNPIELENNLKLLEQEFQKSTQDMPCTRPPRTSDLMTFLEELRTLNADVARELTG